MQGVLDQYNDVIFNEPRYHKLVDWICLVLVVFISTYGLTYVYLSNRQVEQGQVLPGIQYIPPAITTPSQGGQQHTAVPVQQI